MVESELVFRRNCCKFTPTSVEVVENLKLNSVAAPALVGTETDLNLKWIAQSLSSSQPFHAETCALERENKLLPVIAADLARTGADGCAAISAATSPTNAMFVIDPVLDALRLWLGEVTSFVPKCARTLRLDLRPGRFARRQRPQSRGSTTTWSPSSSRCPRSSSRRSSRRPTRPA